MRVKKIVYYLPLLGLSFFTTGCLGSLFSTPDYKTYYVKDLTVKEDKRLLPFLKVTDYSISSAPDGWIVRVIIKNNGYDTICFWRRWHASSYSDAAYRLLAGPNYTWDTDYKYDCVGPHENFPVTLHLRVTNGPIGSEPSVTLYLEK